MHLGYIFILSGALILMGCFGVAMILVAEGKLTQLAILIATGISILIMSFNLITFPPSALLAKWISALLGILALMGGLLIKRKQILLAKIAIVASIILGLAQLILIV